MPDPLAEPPPLFRIRQDIDGVIVQMPRRVSTGSGGQLWVLMVGFVFLFALMMGLWLLPVGLGLIFTVLLESSGLLALLGGIVLMLMGIAPFLAIIFGYRWVSSPGRLRVTQRTLRMEGRGALEIPLESVQRIEIVAGTERGCLRFITTEGEHELFDGLFIPELEWLAELAQHHAHRYREMLAQEGHDMDQAARPPRALVELVRRPR